MSQILSSQRKWDLSYAHDGATIRACSMFLSPSYFCVPRQGTPHFVLSSFTSATAMSFLTASRNLLSGLIRFLFPCSPRHNFHVRMIRISRIQPKSMLFCRKNKKQSHSLRSVSFCNISLKSCTIYGDSRQFHETCQV